MNEPKPRRRLRMGKLSIDLISFDEALDAIGELVRSTGGGVFTPNVDHVVLVETDTRLREAYSRARLSVADGMPVVWASRALGYPVPEKISGSDLIEPVVARAAKEGWSVYFFGGMDGVAEKAAEVLKKRYPGLVVAGCESPRIDMKQPASARAEVLARVKAAKPNIVLVALGAPKQELWIDEVAPELAPAVLLGIGASLDFVAGTVKRAPRWMSENGLEWAFRLGQEPRRLWRRYLVQDPKFAAILLRAMRTPRNERLESSPA